MMTARLVMLWGHSRVSWDACLCEGPYLVCVANGPTRKEATKRVWEKYHARQMMDDRPVLQLDP